MSRPRIWCLAYVSLLLLHFLVVMTIHCQLLNPEITKRYCSLNELKLHPFFEDYDWDQTVSPTLRLTEEVASLFSFLGLVPGFSISFSVTLSFPFLYPPSHISHSIQELRASQFEDGNGTNPVPLTPIAPRSSSLCLALLCLTFSGSLWNWRTQGRVNHESRGNDAVTITAILSITLCALP